MFGKSSRINAIKLRKQILIAESELNRVHLIQDWQTMSDEALALVHEARTIRSMASSAASLVAGLTAMRRKHFAPVAEKPSWLQTLLRSAGQISNLWSAFQSADSRRKE